ncbi:MAG: hypothetical protein ACYC9O_14115 [Candidatus Latescibacterota bacterium]
MRPKSEAAIVEHMPDFSDQCQPLFEHSPQPMVALEGKAHVVPFPASSEKSERN